MACSVSAESFRLSPLATLVPLALKLITSADRRLAASSNEIRVRVEFSRKKFTTVRPRERRHLLDHAGADLAEGLGGVQDPHDVVGASRRPSRAGAFVHLPRRRLLHARRRPRRRARSRARARRRRAAWGRSCRRSRRGSGARGAPGRPGRRAGSVRGRPKSISASIAARIVRPVNRTSSTSTRVVAVDVERDPGLVDLGRLRLQPDVVAVEGDVEDPDRDLGPSIRWISAARRRARWSPRFAIPMRATRSAPLSRSMISWAIRVRARRTSSASQELRTQRERPLGHARRRMGTCVICSSLPGLSGPDLKGKDSARHQHTRAHGPFMATPGTPT